jgi:mono/diheme cytochrome c family protein
MRTLALFTAVALMAASPALAQGDAPSGSTAAKPAPVNGELIYHQVCAACHMHDGKGATGAATIPALAGDPRLAAAAYPIVTVLIGKGVMQGFDGVLTKAQIAQVVGYIRTNLGNAYSAPVTEADVLKIAAGNPHR